MLIGSVLADLLSWGEGVSGTCGFDFVSFMVMILRVFDARYQHMEQLNIGMNISVLSLHVVLFGVGRRRV